jgi:hypothetical protein
MQHRFSICQRTLLLAGAACSCCAAAGTLPVVVERFDSAPSAEWTVVSATEATDGQLDWKPDQPGLWFMTPTAAVSPGMAVRDWPVGEAPFEVEWTVALEGGDAMDNRVPSIHVAVTTAPPQRMRPHEDVAVVMGVGNPGVSAGVRRGPLYQLNQNREGHPPFRARLLDEWLPGLGSGGRNANVGWFDNQLGGQTVSLRMRRTADGKLHFAAWHHSIGLDKPWWEAECDVPKELAGRSLSHLAVLVSPAPRGHPFHGPQSRVRGWLHDLQARPLDVPRPVVASVAPEGGVARAGGLLVIRGEQFGTQPRVFAGGLAAKVERASDAEIVVRLPELARGRRHALEVRHDSGTVGRWTPGLTVGRVLERFEPREVSPAGGDMVLLMGAGFGTDVRIAINGRPAEIVERLDATRLRLRTPAGVAGLARVEAVEDGETFAGAPVLAYAPHPCIACRPEQLDALRRKFNAPALACWREVILAGADAPVDLASLDGPDASNHPCFPWLAYMMTGEPRYREKTMAIIGVICAQRTHEQFHIQKAVPVAVVYDSLFRELTPRERNMMIAYLDRSLDLYLDRTRRNDWWFANNRSNTIGVGGNGGGHAALALLFSRPEDSRRALDTAVDLILRRYQGVADDGACIEGTLYWDYGLTQQVMLGHALRNALGDDRGLLKSPRIENAIAFASSQMGGAGFMFVNNDTQPFLTGVAIAADAGSRYDQPFMRWLADRVVDLSGRNATEDPARRRVGVFTRPAFVASAFFYRDETPSPAEMPPLPTAARMDSVQWATLRSGPGLLGPMVLNIKGHAGPLTHHKHPDKGNFQLHARGEAFVITPGYYNSKPADLGIPLLDGKAGDMEAGTAAPIADLWENGALRGATVDATAAYAKTAGARRVVRHFVMVRDETVVVLDDIVPAANTPGEVTAQWQAHYPVVADGGRAVIRGERSDLHLRTFGPQMALAVEGPRDFARSWVYRAFQEAGWVQWHSLRGRYTATADRPLLTVLQVADRGHEPAPPSVEHGGSRITVRFADGTTLRFRRDRNGAWQRD